MAYPNVDTLVKKFEAAERKLRARLADPRDHESHSVIRTLLATLAEVKGTPALRKEMKSLATRRQWVAERIRDQVTSAS